MRRNIMETKADEIDAVNGAGCCVLYSTWWLPSGNPYPSLYINYNNERQCADASRVVEHINAGYKWYPKCRCNSFVGRVEC